MKSKKTEDIIAHDSLKEKEIVKVFRKVNFRIALVSDNIYYLNGYAVTRLINILMTSNRPVRALKNYEKLMCKSSRTSRLPDWNKTGAGIIDQEN